MGINDNTDDVLHFDANVDNTTRQGNLDEDVGDPPTLLREGPRDQPEEIIEGARSIFVLTGESVG